MRKIIILVILSACLANYSHGSLNQEIIKEFQVEPLMRYRLSFNAIETAEDNATWELQIFNKEGLLPYEGVYAYDWQKIVPERKQYTHSFLTPRDGDLLKFIVGFNKDIPQITDIKLEKITDSNPVINGDFSAGLDNYSGWNDHNLAKLVKNDKGKIVLKCEATGYVLTDPIPVEPGSIYKYTPSSFTVGRVLIYDYDLLRVDMLKQYHARNNPQIKMPEEAAYIRLEYCDGRTYRPGCPPVINKVGLELVKKGENINDKVFPAYPGEIILAAKSALPEVRGAREIQHWVRKISGKEMRVLAVPSNKENTKIFIGKKWAEKLFTKDIKYLEGSDGFAIRQKNKDIYIFSAKPAGTLFGAIRFLENNTDIIFARPRKEFGTIYSKNPDLVFKKTNVILRPSFIHRASGSPYAYRTDDGIWQGRAGLNTSSYFYNQFRRKEEGGEPSSINPYLPTITQAPEYSLEIIKEKYPKLFAEVAGKRKIGPNSYICPSHPIAGKAIAAGLCAIIKKAEEKGIDLEHLGVRIRDGWTVCSCKKCLGPIKLPDGTLLKPRGETAQKDQLFFSTRKAIMLNKAAEEFAKTYPDRQISIEAYIYTSEPPAIPYKSSLIPTFCAYDTCSLRFPILDGKNNHFSSGRLWEKRFREWLKRNKGDNRKLSMFAYYYVPGFSAVADSVAADWTAMVKSGNTHSVHLDSFTPDTDNYNRRVQYQYMWDYEAIERWIITRLMWDPTLDPQKLREYYIKRAYGKAAPEMLEFYNIIRKIWKDPNIKFAVNCHSGRASIFENLIVKTGNEKKLRAILVKAEKKAVNPSSKILIQRTLAAFDRFAECLNRIYVPFVPESTAEWNVAESTFWMQALKMGEFKQVSTWDDFKQAPSLHQTKVAVMRDKENLYFRFEALKAEKQDRVELILEAKRFSTRYFFALGCNGKRYDMRNSSPWNCSEWEGKVENDKDSYTAMFKIPLSVIKELNTKEKDFKVFAKLIRLSGNGKDREESSLTGVSATMFHYMNYWTALSIKKRN